MERLAAFLALLSRYRRCAVEFRKSTGDTRQIYDLLVQHNAAYCIFDLAGYRSPLQATADFCYIRLHGPGGKYQGRYGDRALEDWARKINNWRNKLAAVCVTSITTQATLRRTLLG